MFQLRQFHLQLAFVRTGPLREDVENQAGAVDHAQLQRFSRLRCCAGDRS